MFFQEYLTYIHKIQKNEINMNDNVMGPSSQYQNWAQVQKGQKVMKHRTWCGVAWVMWLRGRASSEGKWAWDVDWNRAVSIHTEGERGQS